MTQRVTKATSSLAVSLAVVCGLTAQTGRFVTRSFLALLIALSLCLVGAVAFAEDIAPLVPSISDDAVKAAPQKSHHKSAATKPSKTQQSAEDAEYYRRNPTAPAAA